METTTYAGIDYGMGLTNRDKQTGIRYGIIPEHATAGHFYDDAEPDYGDPTCPKCGNEAKEYDNKAFEALEEPEYNGSDYYCEDCAYSFFSDEAFPEEAIGGHNLEDNEYSLHMGTDDSDIWVFRSPYYTYAQFCSPCAPGACYLTNPLKEPQENNKAYCLGPEWFDEEHPCPYPIYSIATNEPVTE